MKRSNSNQQMINFLFIFMLILFNSCQQNPESNAKMLMGKWYKKKIFFPTELNLINLNDTINKQRFINKPQNYDYEIVHYFTADCDKCINELKSAKIFVDKHNDPKIKYIFIACGPTDIYVRDAIRQSKFPLPVYFDDEYYGYKTLNHLPITDNLYNTVLLNNNNEAILFGYFFGNKKAEILFEQLTSK